MIPKVIHYCWFGKNDKPKSVLKYIATWKAILPDFEIKEWNESNFDVDALAFTKEAYACRKYAFVSDVARLKALRDEGGIYLDTDVKVVKRFDAYLNEPCFMSWENQQSIGTGVIGAEKNNAFIVKFLESYDKRHFVLDNGCRDETPNTETIMKIMNGYGLDAPTKITRIDGICSIYPKDYFSVKELETGRYFITDNTCCIHDFSCSWTPWYWRFYMVFKRKYNLLLHRQFQ